MGILPWDLDGGFSTPLPERAHSPRLTAPFCVPRPHVLSPSYGILEAREAHDWFLRMMRENEEFEVETDRAGELPVPFSSDTVRRVVVE